MRILFPWRVWWSFTDEPVSVCSKLYIHGLIVNHDGLLVGFETIYWDGILCDYERCEVKILNIGWYYLRSCSSTRCMDNELEMLSRG